MKRAPTKMFLIHEKHEQRFWSKVALPNEDGCMLWGSGGLPNGYGVFHIDKVPYLAHRVACVLAHGQPVGARSQAAHYCRHRRCVAPWHLRWATSSENALDKRKDGTDSCGEKNPNARLTWDQVTQIRARAGTLQREFADKYGVSQSTISRARLGQCWNFSPAVDR
jgi:hypothetical protein